MAWTTPGTATAGEVLTASFWNTQVRDNMNAVGLVHINTTTFSAASSTNISNVFTSAFANYRIFLDISTVSADSFSTIQLRSGSTTTTSAYEWAYDGRVSTTGGADTGYSDGVPTDASWYSTYCNNGLSANGVFDLSSPQLARVSIISGVTTRIGTGPSGIYLTFGGVLNNSTQYDGLTLARISGTHTGTIRIYGYQNG